MDDHTVHSNDRLTDQNFFVIWLNMSIDESDTNYSNILIQLQQIANKILIFTDVDKCIDYVTEIIDEDIFMIISSTFNQQLIFDIHDISKLYSIHILSDDHATYHLSMNKIRRISHSITDICESLKQDIKRYDYGCTSVSIISLTDYSKKNLNELPPSFMYSQILKEILFEIGQHPTAKEDLIHFWYQQYCDNEPQLQKIGEFERNYNPDSAIRWYTRENFIYSILNRALRTLDVEIIIKMGFYLRDLHEQITKKHKDPSITHRIPNIVYRGQAMHNDDFEKLRDSRDGLLSFNCFLSTSANVEVSKMFCPIPPQDPHMTAVLFKIQLNPNSASTPFILLDNESNFSDEQEILFSMHSVFRIIDVTEIEEYLWQATLEMTSDDDNELSQLTEFIRKETQGGPAWHRLGLLLMKIGKFDKAEEIYEELIKQTPKDQYIILSFFYNQIGLTKHYKGDFQNALEFYYKKLEIEQKILPATHLNFSFTYNNIASIYLNQGKYEAALEFYHKTLKIEENCRLENNPDLAITYLNIGVVHRSNGKYWEALPFYKKSLEIYQKSLPQNHPDLTLIYNNIATLHYHLEQYTDALQFHKKTLDIISKSLPPNHPHLAFTYSSIGSSYKKMNKYDKALDFYHKALTIYEASLPSDHPSWATTYNNIASLYFSTREYQQALDFYDKVVTIEKKTFGTNHPELGQTYSNIGAVYTRMEDYCNALSCYEEAITIIRQSLSADHPALGLAYNNIGVVYFKKEDIWQALHYFQLALPILQNSLPPNHSHLRDCQENISRIRVSLS